MFDLTAVQSALQEFGLDGWLLYDFRGANVLAQRVLGLTEPFSRRFFYCIPAQGEPRRLVHRIEPGALDHLPGSKTVYLRWQELEEGVAQLTAGLGKVAMEYSPQGGNPYVSRVDAGTIEMVRNTGVEIVSSGDLVQLFEAVWTEEQWQLHLEADKHTQAAFDLAWSYIAEKTRSDRPVGEVEVQDLIMQHFHNNNMTTYHPPIVGVGPHSGDPHYAPQVGSDSRMHQGDFVLIDLWAKIDHPNGVYSDLTKVGFIGEEVPETYEKIFQIVAAARDAAIDRVKNAFAAGEELRGWQVDDAARQVITDAGYGEYFRHRTGHNIGRETHGNGANIDNLETRDDRRLLPRTCFSIEPGIYLPEFGVRSEVDVFIDAAGTVHVTGGQPQRSVLPILAAY
ncbi:M24 family metallopeptidase [Lignipirellula cremea]|uniref:Xaa-Pro dipeptidase n=1 Tax=Lignipirellula cremea TaxID=2528010 RepID=A0A518E210_9BACT|nr:M24 family metallopeptidase [Lignipirellula cremea]QDU98128.1 Xaa-Pro dipeptidase [Lignipirellula cremea]